MEAVRKEELDSEQSAYSPVRGGHAHPRSPQVHCYVNVMISCPKASLPQLPKFLLSPVSVPVTTEYLNTTHLN